MSKNELTAKDLFHKHIEYLTAADVDGWNSLWADNATLVIPYPIPGEPPQLEGKDAIVAHTKDWPKYMKFESFTIQRLHETTNPSVVIAEYTCVGSIPGTERPYRQAYISVFESKDGKLVRVLDYRNPLVSLDAGGQTYPAPAAT